MARAAVKAKQAQRAKAQPAKAVRRGGGRRRHAGGGNPNQQLFFMRLRRHAKLAYLVLAVLFAATFAFLGVGSGTNSGLDQLFNGLNIFGGGGGTSVSQAQKRVDRHPNDPAAVRALATAYESKGDTADAVTTLQRLTVLQPRSTKTWAELGGMQLQQAQDSQAKAAAAYQAQQLAAPSTPFRPTGTLGTALGTNPIESAASQQAGSSLNTLYQQMTLSYDAAISSYQKVAAISKDDANAEFQLAQVAQTAYQATGSPANAQAAVNAYKTYLKLNPSSTSADQVRSIIKQLQPPPPAPAKKKK